MLITQTQPGFPAARPKNKNRRKYFLNFLKSRMKELLAQAERERREGGRERGRERERERRLVSDLVVS